MNSISHFNIEFIREAIDFPKLVSETVSLPHSPNGRSPVMVKCPFHEDKNPSMAIYSDHAYCFGCGKNWDPFGWVMEVSKVGFPEALERLAKNAGIPIEKLSSEQKKDYEAQRKTEEILELAVQYYASQLWSDSGVEALTYARSRGWADETIRQARLGFAQSNQGLKSFLENKGIDLKLVRDIGLLRTDGQDFCANQDGYKKCPNGYLIYAHNRGGRIEYLASRSITGKEHRNIPGKKLPYYNHIYSSKSERIVIVEGQADAISLAEFGLPSVAMCGSGPSETIESLKGHKFKYISPDSDGKTKITELVDIFGPLHRVILLPTDVKDLNAYHQSGKTGQDFNDLLENAPTWLQTRLEAVLKEKGDHRGVALREIFQRIAKIDDFILVELRSQIAKTQEINLTEYDRLLKISKEQLREVTKEGPIGKHDRYLIENCEICEIKTKDNLSYIEPLCNFVTQITEEVIRDNGEESSLEFKLVGRLNNGKPLREIKVPASSFNSLNWVSTEWGGEPVICAGFAKKDRLREAIQLLSPNISKRRVFTHTGWTNDEGKYVYLSSSGGLGAIDVVVDLENGLENYRLPIEIPDPVAAMQASLRFLDVGPYSVTIPLWASVFLAPFSEFLWVAFVLWLYGITGTRKSTIAALALNHYGEDFATNSLPADWWATDNALEKLLFLAKDALFIIDDYRPESDSMRRKELEGKVARIVRHVGNRSGRSRMKQDTTLRQTFRPRGLAMSTGEQIPSGQSIVARLFVVEIKKDDINLEKLSAAQNESHLYSLALAGFLVWLSPQIDALKRTIPNRWKKIRQELQMNNQHGRIAEIVASLRIALELILQYAIEIEAITENMHDEILEKGLEALLFVADQQNKRVEIEKPTICFFSVIADLLIQQKVFLRRRDNSNQGLGGRPDVDKAELIGWFDDEYIYLMSAAYHRVAQYCSEEGRGFSVKEATLRKMLDEEDYLIKDPDRHTTRIRIEGHHERVLQVYRGKFEEFVVNKIPEWS